MTKKNLTTKSNIPKFIHKYYFISTLETEDIGGGTRCSTTMKWYSTDSLHTAQRSPIHIPETNYSDMTKLTEIANHHNVNKKSNLVIIHTKKNSKKGHSIITLVSN